MPTPLRIRELLNINNFRHRGHDAHPVATHPSANALAGSLPEPFGVPCSGSIDLSARAGETREDYTRQTAQSKQRTR